MSAEQERALEAAWAEISEDTLRDLALSITSIPSPTGEEGALARFLTDYMRSHGLEARYQPIDDLQANAVARHSGSGGGPDLLLYAPIDTLTVGREDEDCPWIGPELRPDMRPEGRLVDGRVVGLGASNPKGHAACIVTAAVALAQTGVRIPGSVLVGLGAGGMPTNKRSVGYLPRFNAGQGSGCSFMLEQGLHADFAVIAKPGWTVDWEEVGLCWFRVEVHGRFSYVGSRHRIPYKNPIVDAARVIEGLEAWFPVYAQENSSGLVAPQGNIGAVEGGWARTASLSPAACNLLVDLRISPRTSPMEARRQFGHAIEEIVARHPDLDLTWQSVLAIPGTSTPPESWIVQSCARAWEAIEGRPHTAARATSGATDANILRHRGIPTARVGMAKLAGPGGEEVDFPMGMNATDPKQMVRLTKLLVYAVIDTCGRDLDAVGIKA
jgi:acetylornithine deacetylase/succinyl-diaminopimelate desuccinylase-like protein